jgi:putative aminopeptidase FrvX
MVIDTLASVARKLSGITWDAEGAIRFYMRRIEAGAGVGRVPAEGILEVELESSDATLMEVAMNAVKATVEKAGADDKRLKTEAEITSFIPVGDPAVNTELIKTVRNSMKDLHIKFIEENGADPSSYLSNQGIPSLSLGIALGWEGLTSDTIDIDSIEKGRQLIETLIMRLSDA